jgi:4-aminobutyrate aminotransferase-like enzyme/Ser/Thr protein kinase RdoA (MazF antagonist)
VTTTSAFGSLELPNPEFSADDARDLLREHWGLEASASEVGSSQDQNFRMRCADGRQYVLKIANPLWRRSELECQNAAMHHVATRVRDFQVPVPVPAPDGSEIVRARGHDLRLVTWLDGTPLAHAGYVPVETWHALGRVCARSAVALADFGHLELDRPFQWDSRRAPDVVGALAGLASTEDREELDRAMRPFAALASLGPALRAQPIHCDVTDVNTVGRAEGGRLLPEGLLDFGDVVRTWRVCDPANAAVSAIVHDADDPLGTALAVLRGYHAESPLDEAEASAFWPLVLARAAVGAIFTTQQAQLSPGNAHVAATIDHEWGILRAVNTVPPALGVAAARAACGLDPSPEGSRMRRALEAAGCARVLDDAICDVLLPVDLSVASPLLAFGAWEDAAAVGEAIALPDGRVPLGRWGEVRLLPARPGPVPPATLHLGADVFAPPGTAVRAPLDGSVERVEPDGGLLLACPVGDDVAYVRLGGIAADVGEGDAVARGGLVGSIAAAAGGALPPHLHVGLSAAPDAPEAGMRRERDAWLALAPDPSPLLGRDVRAPAPPDARAAHARRASTVAAAQRLYYDEPPEFVRGWRHILYDTDGRPYVDAVNNVAVLGHSHPGVAAAAARQFRLLNTNSRFLYGAMTEYAERLTALLPEPLDRVFLVNSGTEAVDLALRLARTFTGRRDVIALQSAYHGWTTATDELSTSTVDRPGWREALPPHIHIVEQPDPYRGRHGDDGPAYARAVAEACRAAEPHGGIAAFLSEPLLGNQGGIVAAPGYLRAAYEHTRAAGGVCIADEIQVGYGRTGDSFWAFEPQGVVPDIVCVAKAAGNGHPVGAVICRREIADAFAGAAPFFSSTGGGPVSCEIGLAVLDAIEQEGLQANAQRVGARLRAGFERLAAEHPVIGAVHGRGLYLGVDLVRDPAAKVPDPEAAHAICERMRALGVVMQPTGDAFNVLKVKPPLCIDETAADHVLAALERTLREGA